MADAYTTIAEASNDIQQRLANVLELRASDPQQRDMLAAYLNDLDLSPPSALLEVGCGTGAVCRELARRFPRGQITGVDPSPVFLEHARRLSAEYSNIRFVEGECQTLPAEAESVDAVIFHTTLSHIPWQEIALQEAFRVLRPGGILSVFDGDYATTTLTTGDHDPLQCCADAAMSALVHDRLLIRKAPALIRAAGFSLMKQRALGIIETTDPCYMLTIVDRGADTLHAAGTIGEDLAQSFKTEARRRAASGSFFGAISYGSFLARK